jgi:hypothetical protein
VVLRRYDKCFSELGLGNGCMRMDRIRNNDIKALLEIYFVKNKVNNMEWLMDIMRYVRTM